MKIVVVVGVVSVVWTAAALYAVKRTLFMVPGGSW